MGGGGCFFTSGWVIESAISTSAVCGVWPLSVGSGSGTWVVGSWVASAIFGEVQWGCLEEEEEEARLSS